MPRLIKRLLDFKTFKEHTELYWCELSYEWSRILTYRIPFKWIHDAKWWLKYRFNPRHQYHLVDTGLKPGYYDKDWVMFNACFSILVDFVENELPWNNYDEIKKIPWYYPDRWYLKKHGRRLAFDYLDWKMSLRMNHLDTGEDDPESDLQINHEMTWGWASKEMKELYLWWVQDRKIEHNQVYSKPYNFEEMDRLDTKDDEQLQRLVRVRGFMWT